ncbi:hypothetical protein M422DRAFT_777266 [Sphaerobolus stellatus SS14]|nr:hypothetical protein M422DRAFT_777266 [Sphaerobolus stellatus SS14]
MSCDLLFFSPPILFPTLPVFHSYQVVNDVQWALTACNLLCAISSHMLLVARAYAISGGNRKIGLVLVLLEIGYVAIFITRAALPDITDPSGVVVTARVKFNLGTTIDAIRKLMTD